MYLQCRRGTLTGGRQAVQHGPWAAVAEFDGGKENSVEVDVVLAHELVEANILVVKPPLLPIRRVVGSDTGVSYAGFKLQSTP